MLEHATRNAVSLLQISRELESNGWAHVDDPVVHECTRIGFIIARELEYLVRRLPDSSRHEISAVERNLAQAAEILCSPRALYTDSSIVSDQFKVQAFPSVASPKYHPGLSGDLAPNPRCQICSHRMPFGSSPVDYEFVRSLQHDHHLGAVGTATLEIRGRIDLAFLQWLRGTSPEDPGPAPDVELVYLLPVPSGSKYPFVLKAARALSQRGERGQGLETDDYSVLRGLSTITECPEEHRELAPLTKCRVSDYSEEVRSTIEDLTAISSVRAVTAFEREFDASLQRQLIEIGQGPSPVSIIKKAFTKPDDVPLDKLENLNETEFRELIKIVLSGLVERKDIPRAGYFELPVEELEPFLDQAVPVLFAIQSDEITRIARERVELGTRSRRETAGYSGPSTGFRLRFEYQIMDMVVDWKRRNEFRIARAKRDGVTPDAVEIPDQIGRRFDRDYPFIESLSQQLTTEPPRRVITMSLKSHITGETLTAEGLDGVQALIRKDTDARIEELERQLRMKSDGHKMVSRQLEMIDEFADLYFFRHWQIVLPSCSICFSDANPRQILERLNYYEEALALLRKSRMQSIHNMEPSRAERQQRQNAEATLFDGAKRSWYYGPRRFFAIQAPTVSDVVISDSAVSKFIYTIDAYDRVSIAREKLSRDGKGTTRPTHSELAKGRAVFGAGELIVGTHQEKLSSDTSWYEHLAKYPIKETSAVPMKLFELNNLSGHYTPNGRASLSFARSVVFRQLESQEIDTSQALVEDRLLTGLRFSGVSFH